MFAGPRLRVCAWANAWALLKVAAGTMARTIAVATAACRAGSAGLRKIIFILTLRTVSMFKLPWSHPLIRDVPGASYRACSYRMVTSTRPWLARHSQYREALSDLRTPSRPGRGQSREETPSEAWMYLLKPGAGSGNCARGGEIDVAANLKPSSRSLPSLPLFSFAGAGIPTETHCTMSHLRRLRVLKCMET